MTYKVYYIINILLIISLFSCQEKEINPNDKIQKATEIIYNKIVDIRRQIHQNPELSGNETETAALVTKYLKDLGLEVKSNFSKNTVVGILKGKHDGKHIAWRADMDAIKMETEDKNPFKSKNKGIAHMCGHDVHTAIGLGIADVISQLKNDLNGTIYFIFQPEEETFVGAKNMIDNGLFEMIKPVEIFGLHLIPSEVGTVSTKAKELFAYQKSVKLNFNKNSNSDDLKILLDQIFMGMERQNQETSPKSLQYLADKNLGIENPKTIYDDYFILQSSHISKDENQNTYTANFLETDVENLDKIKQEIKKLITDSEFKSDFISMDFSGENPTVYNHVSLTNSVFESKKNLLHGENLNEIYGQIPYFNEDFIYYQQKIPGVLFFLGASNQEKDILAMPHTPSFNIDEETIKVGIEFSSSLLLDRLNNSN